MHSQVDATSHHVWSCAYSKIGAMRGNLGLLAFNPGLRTRESGVRPVLLRACQRQLLRQLLPTCTISPLIEVENCCQTKTIVLFIPLHAWGLDEYWTKAKSVIHKWFKHSFQDGNLCLSIWWWQYAEPVDQHVLPPTGLWRSLPLPAFEHLPRHNQA